MRTIEVDERRYAQLLMMMGYAVGAAVEQKDLGLEAMFINLANYINRDNPEWMPVKVRSDDGVKAEAERN